MAEFDIGSIDKNLEVAARVKAHDLVLYDIRKPPFQIYGLYQPTTEPVFKRMPTEVAQAVSKGVRNLHGMTAGGRVRFSTNSPYVVIKAVMPNVSPMNHMPLTGTSGFDLYIDSADGMQSLFHRTFVPPASMTDGYESKIDLGEAKWRHFTINFPLYNAVTALYVGIADGSELGQGAPYRDLPPVVYYGSSITQGGCASRPGNAYTAMVGRFLNVDHINLGFSGNARAEDTMVKYLSGLKMSAFVSDYDHNAPNVDHLRATHQKMYDAIRENNPDVPYLLLSRPDYFRDVEDSIIRRQVVIDTFHYAVAKGDKNVYYIDGGAIFRGMFEDCCTVDGTHPNDLGFSRMADAVYAVLHRALRDDTLLKG